MKNEVNGELVTKITIIIAFLVSGANLAYCIVNEKELGNAAALFIFMVLWTGWYFIRQKRRGKHQKS